ncbi:MAG: VWA domain-containing protein [Planctomycetota bacterium]|nr:MAG: VWA domain-containing protein [Planctomycetota bacterium]
MSLLYPLFLAGFAAVALPIVFHMIRRAPSGRTSFSSLMFLRTSPPRLARRQRLDQLVLLALRALALALLAFAFARPYFRVAAQVGADAMLGPRIALLVDTSASMRRTGLWSAAATEVEAVLADAPPDSVFALATFDRGLTHHVRFEETLGLDDETARALVRERLASSSPSWAATDLGGALAALVEELEGAVAPGRTTRVVLVSDVQAGSDLAALEGYDWPVGIELEVRSLRAAGGNASLHPVPRAANRDDDALWVRVASGADSVTDRFQLQWSSAVGEAVGEAKTIACPPGETRVVRAPARPLAADGADIDRLVLTGDANPFDNVWLDREAVAAPVVVPFLVALDGAVDSTGRGLEFFLERIFEGTDGAITLAPQAAARAPRLDAAKNPLVLFELAGSAVPPYAILDACVRHAAAGGVVLAVVAVGGDDGRDDGSLAAATRVLRVLLAEPRLELREAPTAPDGFALLGEIDFAHPLFAPFSDPRFSDFTKIRFWRHRVLELPPTGRPESAPRVLARFDDGAPFLVERMVGPGRILVVTSGWGADDSDFALSSKFAPLVLGMLRLGAGPDLAAATFHVGDRVPLPPAGPAGTRTVRRPDGTTVTIPPDASAFTATESPGHYALEDAGRSTPFTIRIDPRESRVEPLDADRLARLGVPIATPRASDPEATRQEQSAELEQRQQLWRFLIVLALGVLMVETVWAGRLARRSVTPVN